MGFSFLILPPLLIIVIILLMFVLSNHLWNENSNLTPFECGFDSSHAIRNPFSLRFFLVALIFLIFDIEIALVLPLPCMIFSAGPSAYILPSLLIFVLLLIGAIYEWNQGALEWN